MVNKFWLVQPTVIRPRVFSKYVQQTKKIFDLEASVDTPQGITNLVLAQSHFDWVWNFCSSINLFLVPWSTEKDLLMPSQIASIRYCTETKVFVWSGFARPNLSVQFQTPSDRFPLEKDLAIVLPYFMVCWLVKPIRQCCEHSGLQCYVHKTKFSNMSWRARALVRANGLFRQAFGISDAESLCFRFVNLLYSCW